MPRASVPQKPNPKRNAKKELVFADHPEFRPNLTPREIFEAGAFGGTYWRPIYSSVIDKDLKNQYKKFPAKWWSGIPKNWLTAPYDEYDIKINKYGVKVGSTLEYWEDHDWIDPGDPYGWVQWYCRFYEGRRCDDDERQIKRWLGVAGPNGRFRRNLIRQIREKGKWDDPAISPRIRQSLLHWAYELTKKDYGASAK
jgi:hypothetical protein